ncbi:MAG: type II secretion system protein [Candidatus Wallbacteria bacterium]|nr:type II secretion system protein [Candidatus Wallbacteria bacterium]
MKKKGFSLPEILVVVALFGILIPVLYWVYKANWLVFHRTTQQQALQEDIRDCLNKMIIDVKSAYKIEVAKAGPDGCIKIQRFNGYAKKDSTTAPPSISYKPQELVEIEYSVDSAKKLLSHKVGGSTRDSYPNIGTMEVVPLTPDTANYTFKAAAAGDKDKIAGFSVYIMGSYLDDSMKGKAQVVEVETKMFSHFLRNYLIFGYDGKPFMPEGGYFTNLEVPGAGNDEF